MVVFCLGGDSSVIAGDTGAGEGSEGNPIFVIEVIEHGR